MARIKVTSTDIYARLAKGECANYRNGNCVGRTPCTIINGEPCQYFATYVKPLLDQADFSAKYAREAKISVALNPQTKVVRKRQLAAAPALAMDSPTPSAPSSVRPAKKNPAAAPPPVKKIAVVETTPVIPALVAKKLPLAGTAKKRLAASATVETPIPAHAPILLAPAHPVPPAAILPAKPVSPPPEHLEASKPLARASIAQRIPDEPERPQLTFALDITPAAPTGKRKPAR